MRKLIFLATLTLASCSPRWFEKHCPREIRDSVHVVDSMSIKIDTTWRVYHNPADSIKLSDNLVAYMDSLGKCRVKDSEGSVESGKIKVKYIIRNDSIFIHANTKPFEIKIAELTKTIDHYRSIYKSHIEKQGYNARRPSWLSYWQSWGAMGITVLSLLIFIVKWLKNKGYKVGVSTIFPFISITKIIG